MYEWTDGWMKEKEMRTNIWKYKYSTYLIFFFHTDPRLENTPAKFYVFQNWEWTLRLNVFLVKLIDQMKLIKDDELTLLMLLGGGWLLVSVSASAPSSHGDKSFHCFSLKRLSIGTTWPSVVKIYLLSDLCSGLSSSNSWNAEEKTIKFPQQINSYIQNSGIHYSQ